MLDVLLIFAAGVGAGAINAIGGGGTLLTFPVLIALGRNPVIANATNALALWPGSLAGVYALRKDAATEKVLLRSLIPVSIVGGLLGGYALLVTPTRYFDRLVPGLVLLATCLLAGRKHLLKIMPPSAASDPSLQRRLVLMAAQFVIGVYGGYFGAAMGIVMLASLSLFGIADGHVRNAVKNVLSTVINGSAGLYFIASGAIAWGDFALLAISAVVGGYVGARLGRRLPASTVERVVIGLGLTASFLLALRLLTGAAHR